MELSEIALKWEDIQLGLILAIIAVAWIAIVLVRIVLGWLTGRMPARYRIYFLPWSPVLRLVIFAVAISLVAPLVIKTSAQALLALVAAISVAIGFAMKDYVASVIAGVLVVIERAYQVGDWIELGGHFGEVTKIGFRAVHLVTVDDNEIILPQGLVMTSTILNATSRGLGLQVAVEFFLHPEHDVEVASGILRKVVMSSELVAPEPPLKISISEIPGATKYTVRAYAKDSRKQFQLRSEITAAAKPLLLRAGVRHASFPFAIASS